MCGIAGFVGGSWSNGDDARIVLEHMGRSLRHRGPDSSAVWLDEQATIGFAHQRLAIVDISAAGNQPMQSHGHRFVITYNGEIYNHLAIRDELAATGKVPNWAGHSDTETLLAAIEAWGVRGAIERATGMFAFALWDKRDHVLTLARDRLGEKPLYCGRQRSDGPFLFGSEL
jgi:asparagine synthase (glutamine-hydrolysing)